ncbi:VOC family protein [Shimia sp. R9_2]|uniref:glyoxalase superfamily protein n=1 Tax=Shimia sp. R9_2 TaxID=2821112 RepID=UPI001ADCF89A|nr:glyoxalase superfamily protein [Shimia sp. R9_2]MBO9397567.1 VOC family protein [Shimia sp. R9_2]
MAETASQGGHEGGSVLKSAIPILRMFDEAHARAFYLDFLGFSKDWEHRHDVDFPLYMQISRQNCLLHLTEHFGDATPGSGCFVPMEGVEAFHAELVARNPDNLRLGLETMPWGQQVKVTDPFGNKLTFCEQNAQAQ